MIDTFPEKRIAFSPGTQLQFIRYMLSGQSPNSLVDNMDALELSQIYDFMWEKALEIGIRVKGDRFSQNDILKRLKSVEQYKAEVGCKEPLQRCITNDCVVQNPECVRAKIRDQFNRLYSLMAEYLGVEFKV